MPVILPREFEAFWLDEDVHDAAVLCGVLTPYSAGEMQVYEVSLLVNQPSNQGAEVAIPARQGNYLSWIGAGQLVMCEGPGDTELP